MQKYSIVKRNKFVRILYAAAMSYCLRLLKETNEMYLKIHLKYLPTVLNNLLNFFKYQIYTCIFDKAPHKIYIYIHDDYVHTEVLRGSLFFQSSA